jgi:hypothetical protein
MNYDSFWWDRSSSWWAKADRAQEHLRSLRQQVDNFRTSNPYSVVPEPTDIPDRTAYRLYHGKVPATISTTVGDVIHNLRSALDSLAYGIAQHDAHSPMSPKEEAACEFPICETPEDFDAFFDTDNKHRVALYGIQAREALRLVQPFHNHEEAIRLGVQVTDTYADVYRWDELYRLNHLWKIDKHRRLATMTWLLDLLYWTSNEPSKRSWQWGDGTFANGSILGYMTGSDPDVGNKVFHEFNLVLTDDPVYDLANPGNSDDVVRLLEGWYRHITDWIFQLIFRTMSRT